jgi:hypothetical protein
VSSRTPWRVVVCTRSISTAVVLAVKRRNPLQCRWHRPEVRLLLRQAAKRNDPPAQHCSSRWVVFRLRGARGLPRDQATRRRSGRGRASGGTLQPRQAAVPRLASAGAARARPSRRPSHPSQVRHAIKFTIAIQFMEISSSGGCWGPVGYACPLRRTSRRSTEADVWLETASAHQNRWAGRQNNASVISPEQGRAD